MTEKGLRFLFFFQLLTDVTISEYGKEPSDGSVIPCRNFRPAVSMAPPSRVDSAGFY
jgi:hypothetical protein